MRKLKLSHDERKLATAGHVITLWDARERKVIKKFSGHASPIRELAFSRQDDILVSIAEDDRYVNVWDAQSTNTNTTTLTVLTLEDNATHVDFCGSEPTVLAVAEDGVVGLWRNASSQATPTSRRKAARSITRQTDSTVKVVSSKAEDTVIPILSATFVSDNYGQSIMIARGSSVRPSFEAVVCIQYTHTYIYTRHDVCLYSHTCLCLVAIRQ